MTSHISFSDSGFYSKLIRDFLSQENHLHAFYPFNRLRNDIRSHISQRTFDHDKRIILSDALHAQYEKAGITTHTHPLLYAQIESLKQSNCYTVTTGHQLVLASGPLFFLVKIIHTIQLAKQLSSAHPDMHFVPVFWMASEDHDFAEIQSVQVNDATVSWNHRANDEPVGRLKPASLDVFFDELIHVAHPVHHQWLTEAKKIYVHAHSLADATRTWVHQLFGDQGLICIDGDDEQLKKQFVRCIEADVLHGQNYEILQHTNTALKQHGYGVQVNGRHINHFYFYKGKRRHIQPTPEGFHIQDTDLYLDRNAMQSEITTHPHYFSPNVVMRPLFQETILPNLAYVGGPGEVAYWLQLADIFEKNGVSYPRLILRNSILPISHKASRIIRKLKMNVEECLSPKDVAERLLTQRHLPTSESDTVNLIKQSIQKWIDETDTFDNQFSSQLITYKKNMSQELSELIRDMNKRKKNRLSLELQLLADVQSHLLPNGVPAERVLHVASYPVPLQTIIADWFELMSHQKPGVLIWPYVS